MQISFPRCRSRGLNSVLMSSLRSDVLTKACSSLKRETRFAPLLTRDHRATHSKRYISSAFSPDATITIESISTSPTSRAYSADTVTPGGWCHFDRAGAYGFMRLSTNRYFEYYWALIIGLFDFAVAECVRFWLAFRGSMVQDSMVMELVQLSVWVSTGYRFSSEAALERPNRANQQPNREPLNGALNRYECHKEPPFFSSVKVFKKVPDLPTGGQIERPNGLSPLISGISI